MSRDVGKYLAVFFLDRCIAYSFVHLLIFIKDIRFTCIVLIKCCSLLMLVVPCITESGAAVVDEGSYICYRLLLWQTFL